MNHTTDSGPHRLEVLIRLHGKDATRHLTLQAQLTVLRALLVSLPENATTVPNNITLFKSKGSRAELDTWHVRFSSEKEGVRDSQLPCVLYEAAQHDVTGVGGHFITKSELQAALRTRANFLNRTLKLLEEGGGDAPVLQDEDAEIG